MTREAQCVNKCILYLPLSTTKTFSHALSQWNHSCLNMPRSTSVTFRLHRWSISISASTGHPHCCEVLSLCWVIPSVYKFRPLTPFYSLCPGVHGFQVVGDKRFILEEERYNSHSDDGWICGLKSGWLFVRVADSLCRKHRLRMMGGYWRHTSRPKLATGCLSAPHAVSRA